MEVEGVGAWWNGGGGSQLFSFLSAQDEPRRRGGSPTLDPDAVL